jgi:opacity protein-like surface antigen
MKRVIVALIGITLLGASAARAGEIAVGIGAFGGGCWAVEQDNVGNGFIYGGRVPVRLLHLLTVEGFYQASSLGEVTTDVGGTEYTIPGFDLSAFGANAIIGSLGKAGLNFYPYVGIGSYELKQNGNSETNTGYSFGLGLGLPPMSKVSIQLRAEGDVIVTGNTSEKFGLLTAGLNYNFGKK